mgnify:CR=1 FL=1
MITTMLEKMKLTEYTPIEKFIVGREHERIGNLVIDDFHTSYEEAITAVSVCRRRFKTSDLILLAVLDEEEKGEAGIAFTRKGIYHWKEKEEFVGGVLYDQIQTLDYDEENVMALRYFEDGRLEEIDDPDEFAEVEEVLNAYLEDPKIQELKEE